MMMFDQLTVNTFVSDSLVSGRNIPKHLHHHMSLHFELEGGHYVTTE